MSGLIGAKSCRSCEWRWKQGQMIFCRRYPPQAHAFIQGDAAGRQNVVWQASYPIVTPEIPCGEYARSELAGAEELAAAMPVGLAS